MEVFIGAANKVFAKYNNQISLYAQGNEDTCVNYSPRLRVLIVNFNSILKGATFLGLADDEAVVGVFTLLSLCGEGRRISGFADGAPIRVPASEKEVDVFERYGLAPQGVVLRNDPHMEHLEHTFLGGGKARK